MKIKLMTAVVVSAVLWLVVGVSAQEIPFTWPPKFLLIVREEILPEKSRDYKAVAEQYAAQMARTGLAAYRIGATSVTGNDEALYIQGFEMFSEMERFLKMIDGSSLSSLDQQLGAFRGKRQVMIATYRPKLSFQPSSVSFTDTRYLEVLQQVVKRGSEQQWEDDTEAVTNQLRRSNLDRTWYTYVVTHGAPIGTVLRIELVRSFEERFDVPFQRPESSRRPTAEEERRLRDFGKETAVREDATDRPTIFAIRPPLSYVPASFRSASPDFWGK